MGTPLNNNDPYIKSTGERSTLGAELANSGSTYTLPTASESVKGGVKIGDNLKMTGEVLDVKDPLPAHTTTDENKVLSVDDTGALIWALVAGGNDFVVNKITLPGSSGSSPVYMDDIPEVSGYIPVAAAWDETGTSFTGDQIGVISVVKRKVSNTFKWQYVIRTISASGSNIGVNAQGYVYILYVKYSDN